MMKLKTYLSLLICFPLMWGCNDNDSGKTSTDAYSGLVLNEVAAHDEITDADSWLEILNQSSSAVDLSGLGIYLYDTYFNGRELHAFGEEKLGAGERLVLSTEDGGLNTGFASDDWFELRLAVSKSGKVIDSFDRDGVESEKALPAEGSFQRIPDGGSWQRTVVSTRGIENVVRSIDNTKHNAIWLWSTYMGDWLENDAEVMKEMKALGYDHVLLNYSGFEYSKKTTKEFLAAAGEIGITVHAWIQCFYSNGSWVNPVDDDNNCYKQELFDSIIERAEGYIDEYGVQGIHLDYIRFPGTAYQHRPSSEITGTGAVTEFCRQLREAMDARGEGIILSAAMMAENNAEYYYGQSAAQMGKYIDILMPMVYRYQENGTTYGDTWCQQMVRLFTTVTDAEVWAGTQSYSYPTGSSGGAHGISSEQLLSDCQVLSDAGATGIVIFRYPYGTFPDLNDFWE